jgi:hypothetical protein
VIIVNFIIIWGYANVVHRKKNPCFYFAFAELLCT